MRAAGHTSAPCDVRSAGAASPSKAGAAAGACAACAVALARAIPQAPAVAASKAAQSQNSAWGASCVGSAGAACQLLRRRRKQAPCGEGETWRTSAALSSSNSSSSVAAAAAKRASGRCVGANTARKARGSVSPQGTRFPAQSRVRQKAACVTSRRARAATPLSRCGAGGGRRAPAQPQASRERRPRRAKRRGSHPRARAAQRRCSAAEQRGAR